MKNSPRKKREEEEEEVEEEELSVLPMAIRLRGVVAKKDEKRVTGGMRRGCSFCRW